MRRWVVGDADEAEFCYSDATFLYSRASYWSDHKPFLSHRHRTDRQRGESVTLELLAWWAMYELPEQYNALAVLQLRLSRVQYYVNGAPLLNTVASPAAWYVPRMSITDLITTHNIKLVEALGFGADAPFAEMCHIKNHHTITDRTATLCMPIPFDRTDNLAADWLETHSHIYYYYSPCESPIYLYVFNFYTAFAWVLWSAESCTMLPGEKVNRHSSARLGFPTTSPPPAAVEYSGASSDEIELFDMRIWKIYKIYKIL